MRNAPVIYRLFRLRLGHSRSPGFPRQTICFRDLQSDSCVKSCLLVITSKEAGKRSFLPPRARAARIGL
jgi:hypothetical protein